MSDDSARTLEFTNANHPRKIPVNGNTEYRDSTGTHGRAISPRFYAFDEEYLRRLTGRDADIECHFVEYFSPLLRAKLQVRLRSVQDVEDLRQEVFLRVLQSLRGGQGVRHPGKLGAFVLAVCNNVLFEHFRGRSRTTQWDDRGPEPRGSSHDLERDLLSEEVRDQVRLVLHGLSAKDRGLLHAVFLEERDKDAVCRDFGVRRDYLRVLLHRARRRLRDLLTRPPANTRPGLKSSASAQQSSGEYR